LIAAGAGVTCQPGGLTHQVGHIVDLHATCLDAAGV
jgi:hypothetical protein